MSIKDLTAWPQIEEMVQSRVGGQSWLSIYRHARRNHVQIPLVCLLAARRYFKRAGLTDKQANNIEFAIAMLTFMPAIVIYFSTTMSDDYLTLIAWILAVLVLSDVLKSCFYAWWINVRQNPFDDVPERWKS